MDALPNAPRIAIAGAGAIGCTLAALLAGAGHAVHVLARGAALAALREHGVLIDDLAGRHRAPVTASDRAEDLGPQDLLFVCAKSQDLPGLLRTCRPLLHAGTVVVPAVNGVPWWYFHREGGRFDGQPVRAVDPHGELDALLPLDQVLGCVVFMTAELVAPASVRSRTPHLIMLGEPSNTLSPRLASVAALLEGAGIEARQLERIRDKLWTKLIGNLSSNPLSVPTGATLEQIYGDPELSPIAAAVLREALLVAAAYGARIELDPHSFLREGAGMGAFRTSMLQDHLRGRPLELAAIGDAVLELADRYQLPMPTTRTIVSLARFCGRHRQAAAPDRTEGSAS